MSATQPTTPDGSCAHPSWDNSGTCLGCGYCAGDYPEYAPAGDPACTAPLGGFAPAVGSRWVDKHHDVWTMRADGLMETPETRPFPPAHVEKKWGPLLPATRPQELAP